MSKIYDSAFKIGVIFSILVFLILNFISFVISQRDYYASGISGFAHSGYSWGFPFELYRNYFGYPHNEIGFTGQGVVLNAFVLVFFSFVIGFLFRFVWSNASARISSLK